MRTKSECGRRASAVVDSVSAEDEVVYVVLQFSSSPGSRGQGEEDVLMAVLYRKWLECDAGCAESMWIDIYIRDTRKGE